ncbi:DUF4157 domain-containing protein [Rivularia sp. UHCC 0363]|uniref:eCIS core domain-containing protein n=1 Tax=Rivularia sp. UHCC 0363 TaxID=3110244 RepID=UPI002B20F96D|nr:DUF4157 domain-containing protein [Rivularia sp. UHCC 0363]MEA5593299.1 DUF4157 domain-containing protein [Rivularia sp. UHCC 0363]
MKGKGLNQHQQQSRSDTNLSNGWLQRAAVREVPGKEVESPVIGEFGLNRSFVNVPVHGGGLPVVQRKLMIGAENRDQATVQRKLQKVANNSPQAQQASQLQIADNYLAQQQQHTEKKTSPEPDVRENNTGLPDNLKSGIENLSGYSMDDVRVHYNSDKPAQLKALAYTQGTEIHLGQGQEKHLSHEAWHVVQQKQGRVKPTMQMKGKVNVNENAQLEKEADVMGAKAMQIKAARPNVMQASQLQTQISSQDVAQTQESLVQRKLNNETIEKYKKTLMLNEVSIIELPKAGAKVIDKFSTYPQDSLYNVPKNILGMTLLDVSMPGVKHDDDALQYYKSVTAYEMVLDMQGGGAFISPFKLAVICEGVSNRALQHEMGHAEQQEALGAQFGGEGTTVNQVILEYHNILLNENEHNDFETIRTHYNSSNLGKHKDKTWEDLMSDATKEYPLNATLLKELRYVMDEIFPNEKVKIERNLISEYYVNVSKK